ncbi:hypothetical protein OIU84_023440 [Salix udensis]|uniref:Uncharacterized protein n=1 Tax=Salix udensis TaxID=889485 RepID=A0AAD6KR77_9ROSI|nr:hypothetical protein OIU84_023440 [Salix udensis]
MFPRYTPQKENGTTTHTKQQLLLLPEVLKGKFPRVQLQVFSKKRFQSSSDGVFSWHFYSSNGRPVGKVACVCILSEVHCRVVSRGHPDDSGEDIDEVVWGFEFRPPWLLFLVCVAYCPNFRPPSLELFVTSYDTWIRIVVMNIVAYPLL